MTCKNGTNHCACDCREAEFAALRQENAIHQTTVRTLSRSLVNAQWHERRLRAALEQLVEAAKTCGLQGGVLDRAKNVLADDQPLQFDEDLSQKT